MEAKMVDVANQQIYEKLTNGNGKYWVIFVVLHIVILFILTLWILVSIYKKKINKQKEQAGIRAEENAMIYLKNFAQENNFTLLNGIFSLIDSKGKDVQFESDGVLITNSSIVVFEVKSNRPVIKSKSIDTFQVYKVNEKRKLIDFPSPVLQNAKHIEHFRNIIDSEIPIYSVIFFINATDVQVNYNESNLLFLCAKEPMQKLANFLNEKAQNDKHFSETQKQTLITIINNAKASEEAMFKFYNTIGKYDKN